MVLLYGTTIGISVFCFVKGYTLFGIICLLGLSNTIGFIALIATSIFLFTKKHWIVGSLPMLLILCNLAGNTLFNKKMSLRDYCNSKFDYLFSNQFEIYANNLKSEVGDVFACEIDQNKYLDHFKGAFLELLGVAFSRTLKRDQRYDVMLLEKEYLKNHNSEKLDSLHQIYNSAFGSSSVDGVMQMAICFADQFPVNNVESNIVIKVYHEGFYQILNTIFDELKRVRFVSVKVKQKEF